MGYHYTNLRAEPPEADFSREGKYKIDRVESQEAGGHRRFLHLVLVDDKKYSTVYTVMDEGIDNLLRDGGVEKYQDLVGKEVLAVERKDIKDRIKESVVAGLYFRSSRSQEVIFV